MTSAIQKAIEESREREARIAEAVGPLSWCLLEYPGAGGERAWASIGQPFWHHQGISEKDVAAQIGRVRLYTELHNMSRTCEPRFREALACAAEALDKVNGQNRTRGYPTGTEWTKLVVQLNEALARIEAILKGEK